MQQQVNEIKLADGIYFSDFRKEQNIFGSQIKHFRQKQDYQLSKDPRILAEDYKEFQSKINILRTSIDDIKEEENWQEDQVFLDAIDENLNLIVKYINNQLNILSEIRSIDPQNSILQQIKIKDLEEEYKISQIKQKDFQFDYFFNKQGLQKDDNQENKKQSGMYL